MVNKLNLIWQASCETFKAAAAIPRDRTPFKLLSILFYAIILTLVVVFLSVYVSKSQPLMDYSSTNMSVDEFMERKTSNLLIDFECQSRHSVLVPAILNIDLPTGNCTNDSWRKNMICQATKQHAQGALESLTLSGTILVPDEIVAQVRQSLHQVASAAQLYLSEQLRFVEKSSLTNDSALRNALYEEWVNVSTEFYSPKGLAYFTNATALLQKSIVASSIDYSLYFETAMVLRCSWKDHTPRHEIAFQILNTSATLLSVASLLTTLVYFICYTLKHDTPPPP